MLQEWGSRTARPGREGCWGLGSAGRGDSRGMGPRSRLGIFISLGGFELPVPAPPRLLEAAGTHPPRVVVGTALA